MSSSDNSNQNKNNVKSFQDFYGGDPRIGSLYEALDEVIQRRAVGELPIATVIGVLELLKNEYAHM